MKLLADRAAVITGAAAPSSIGLAVAEIFVEHGACVALLDVDSAVSERAAGLGPGHLACVVDVSDKMQCDSALLDIKRAFGHIDILVNSAGIVRGTRIADIGEGEYQKILGVNLQGNFLMSQAVLPHMREQGLGCIVCISSIAGQSGGGVFGSSHYAAAKAGIFGFAKALARELAPEGIRVNAIAPGPIDNDFTQGRMTREIKQEIARKIPMGRLGRPREVANACLFLASDMSSYITGTVLDVNGGLLIH